MVVVTQKIDELDGMDHSRLGGHIYILAERTLSNLSFVFMLLSNGNDWSMAVVQKPILPKT